MIILLSQVAIHFTGGASGVVHMVISSFHVPSVFASILCISPGVMYAIHFCMSSCDCANVLTVKILSNRKLRNGAIFFIFEVFEKVQNWFCKCKCMKKFNVLRKLTHQDIAEYKF